MTRTKTPMQDEIKPPIHDGQEGKDDFARAPKDLKYPGNSLYYSGPSKMIETHVTKKENMKDEDLDLGEIEKKIVKILEEKIRPAVARDGGDIKFKEFKDGVVKVQLQGSCSGCPSSLMTLKQGVQNLLKHYVKEVNSVEAIQ